MLTVEISTDYKEFSSINFVTLKKTTKFLFVLTFVYI